MKNKKKKLFLSVLILVGIPVVFNFLISKLSKLTLENNTSGKSYKWKYGNVHYTVKGEGEPLVLLHSLRTAASKEEWANHIATLSTRYKVYSFDWLGYGKSDKPKLTYSTYLYTSLLNDFIKNVVKKPANVIAFSHASDIAVNSYILNKKAYNKIMLITPTGIGDELPTVTETNIWLKRLMELPIYGTFYYNVMTSIPKLYFSLNNKCHTKGSISMNVIKNLACSAQIDSDGAKYPFALYENNYFNTNIERHLENVDIPMYIIWGDNEHTINNIDKVQEINPDIKTIYFSETKEYPQIESKIAFYKTCKTFFE